MWRNYQSAVFEYSIKIKIFGYHIIRKHTALLKNTHNFLKLMWTWSTLTTPNPAKSSKGHFFFGNIQHRWKLVLSPLQMGQNYYLARSSGHKCWIWKINKNAWCILKDMFPKVHWWILEDSWGRFLARISRGLGLRWTYNHTKNCSHFRQKVPSAYFTTKQTFKPQKFQKRGELLSWGRALRDLECVQTN